MNSNYNKKIAVRVLYPCHLCGSSYTKGAFTIDHMVSIHGMNLPKRPTGRKRPKDEYYNYIGINGTDWDEIHHGCSACWFHTSEMKTLQNHVHNVHGPDRKRESDEDIARNIARKIIELGELFASIL